MAKENGGKESAIRKLRELQMAPLNGTWKYEQRNSQLHVSHEYLTNISIYISFHGAYLILRRIRTKKPMLFDRCNFSYDDIQF